jgi:hypothetical protein
MKYQLMLLSACALATNTAQAQTTPVVTTPPVAATTAPIAATPPTAAPIADAMAKSVAAPVILAAGTSVTFIMDKALASDERDKIKGEKKLPKGKRRITNKGDTFTMTVAQDVRAGDQIVIPKGSRGFGEVIEVGGRGGFGKSGKINIKMNHVEVGSNKYALDGEFLQKGKGRGGAAVAGTIIAGAIAGAFIKGDDADIPMGTEMTFRTKDEIKLP